MSKPRGPPPKPAPKMLPIEERTQSETAPADVPRKPTGPPPSRSKTSAPEQIGSESSAADFPASASSSSTPAVIDPAVKAKPAGRPPPPRPSDRGGQAASSAVPPVIIPLALVGGSDDKGDLVSNAGAAVDESQHQKAPVQLPEASIEIQVAESRLAVQAESQSEAQAFIEVPRAKKWGSASQSAASIGSTQAGTSKAFDTGSNTAKWGSKALSSTEASAGASTATAEIKKPSWADKRAQEQTKKQAGALSSALPASTQMSTSASADIGSAGEKKMTWAEKRAMEAAAGSGAAGAVNLSSPSSSKVASWQEKQVSIAAASPSASGPVAAAAVGKSAATPKWGSALKTSTVVTGSNPAASSTTPQPGKPLSWAERKAQEKREKEASLAATSPAVLQSTKASDNSDIKIEEARSNTGVASSAIMSIPDVPLSAPAAGAVFGLATPQVPASTTAQRDSHAIQPAPSDSVIDALMDRPGLDGRKERAHPTGLTSSAASEIATMLNSSPSKRGSVGNSHIVDELGGPTLVDVVTRSEARETELALHRGVVLPAAEGHVAAPPPHVTVLAPLEYSVVVDWRPDQPLGLRLEKGTGQSFASVSFVHPDGQAYRLGVETGDELLAAATEPVTTWSQEQLRAFFVACAQPCATSSAMSSLSFRRPHVMVEKQVPIPSVMGPLPEVDLALEGPASDPFFSTVARQRFSDPILRAEIVAAAGAT